MRKIHTSMETIADICNVPMIRSGNMMMKTGRTVKMGAHRGTAAVPVSTAMIIVMINTMYAT